MHRARWAMVVLACTACAGRARAATVADPVLEWNQTTLKTLAAEKEPRTPIASRVLAMVHAAIYDAVNDVERRYTPYAVDLTAPPGASA